MTLYLDTSLLVAALTNEARTGEMQDWMAGQPVGQLVISDWVMTEFSGALSLKVRTEQLTAEDRADVLSVFRAMVENSLRVLPVSRQDFHDAARLADQYSTGLRSGDALHLAIAENQGVRLCSLDRKLVAAAHTLGVSALLL